MLCLLVTHAFSQANAPKYVDIAFMKSTSPDFLFAEKKLWVPVHRQLIKDGKKAGWYLYRVKYPTGTKAEYDYVRFNVFTDWKQVEVPYGGLAKTIKKVHPALDTAEFMLATGKSRQMIWEQLFQVIDEAATKIDHPSQFIVVNQVKSVSGAEGEYVKMELTYFKPFHAERVVRGVMNNWSLYKPIMPYGEKYPYDYVTLNGFDSWEQITANNPPDVWKKVHGNINFDEIHSKILQKRITVNNEVWELVASAQD
jgi:hypothetical protein